jgi:photosystem II stability/assembly factor-like uncharacterized protein
MPALAAVLVAALPSIMNPALASGAAPPTHAISHAAAWTTRLLAPGPTQFSDVSCPTALICTAIGTGASDQGAILRTTDGGATWTRQVPPAATPYLSAVDCPTAAFCLAESYDSGGNAPTEISYSIFTATTDAGATWTTSTSASSPSGTAPVCAGATRCYLSATSSVSRSTDGGASWQRLSMSGWRSIDTIACVLRSACFVLGMPTGSRTPEFGRITGYGARFLRVAALPALQGVDPSWLSCASLQSCAAIGVTAKGPLFLTTSDGGTVWRIRSLPGSIRTVVGVSCARGGYCVVAGTHRGVPLLTAATTDDGATWSVSRTSVGAIGASISCPLAGTCFMAGTSVDSVLVSSADDAAWSTETVPAGPSALSAVACTAANTCVAVGPGVAMTSSDGGVTWTTASHPPPVDEVLVSLACPTDTTCLAGGPGVLYRSADAGATWQLEGVPASDRFSAITCASATTCFATTAPPGGTGGSDLILRTTDAGVTWQSYTFSGALITSISCGSPIDCVAVAGNGEVYATSNAGGSWTHTADVSASTYGAVAFLSVSCTSSTVCVASGIEPPWPLALVGGTYQTTDGGVTWSRLSSWFGAVACSGSQCLMITPTPLLIGLASPWLGMSVDGGADWSAVTLPEQPASTSGATITPSGRWVVVGGDSLNGALVATSP